MVDLEAIRKQNGTVWQAGSRRAVIRDLCDEVERLRSKNETVTIERDAAHTELAELRAFKASFEKAPGLMTVEEAYEVFSSAARGQPGGWNNAKGVIALSRTQHARSTADERARCLSVVEALDLSALGKAAIEANHRACYENANNTSQDCGDIRRETARAVINRVLDALGKP